VNGAVKGGGWVEEIKKFLNMKNKKFPRNSGENLPNFYEAEFHVIPRNSDQSRSSIRMYEREIIFMRNSVLAEFGIHTILKSILE
jgi:hypothetical protein